MPRFMQLVAAWCLAGILAGGGLATAAAAPGPGRALGAEVRVSSAGGSEVTPAVAWNPTTQQYLVVWEDGRTEETTGTNLYGRLLSATGAPAGPDFLIAAGPGTSRQQAPAVAWNGATYLVVWQDWRNGVDPDIWGRRVGANGVPSFGEFRISRAAATGDQRNPAIAWNDTTGQYLVVWDDYRAEATRGVDIFGRLIDAAGEAVAPDFRVSRLASLTHQLSPSVAWNEGSNEYLVVWEDHRDDGDYRVFGRRIDGASGVPLGGDIRLSGSGAQNAILPAVASDGTGYVVVWEDWREYTEDVLNIGSIYGRLLGADAIPVDRDLRISSRLNDKGAGSPGISWSAVSSHYLATWTDGRNVVWDGPDPLVGNDVYARRLGADGAAVGPDFRVSTPTTSEIDPAVAAGNGWFLVAWCDERNAETAGTDIYGRRASG